MGWQPHPDYPDLRCSLGYEAIAWIINNCCHGPGDLQGQRASIDKEMREFIVSAYELDPVTGRRLVTEAILSLPKGRAKTEIAGWLVCFEAYGPCRFDYWDENDHYQPVGKRQVSPLIKCLATEESQAQGAFAVVAYIVEWGKDEDQGNKEVYKGSSGVRQYQSATAIYLPMETGGGEIRACSSGAASKDGGKETFVVCDESHLYVLANLKSMYATISRNLPKRKIAEPWMLQTTTAYRQGELSVAEESLKLWRKGELPETVLVEHHEAHGRINIRDRDHTLEQLRQVYGAAAVWMNLDYIYQQMLDPRVCRDDAEAARYYLNRVIASRDAWIAKDIHERQTKKGELVEKGDSICLGFDGSLNDDSTVLRGCRMSDGFLFKLGAWEKPDGQLGVGWEVPREEVIAAWNTAFTEYDVVRMYADPHEWRSDLAAESKRRVIKTRKGGSKWLEEERVVPWETRRDTAMAYALDRLHADLVNGQVFHDDDPIAADHYGNAYLRKRGELKLVRKEYPNSPRKIDSVVADALAYEARADAIAEGWTGKPKGVTRVRGKARAR